MQILEILYLLYVVCNLIYLFYVLCDLVYMLYVISALTQVFPYFVSNKYSCLNLIGVQIGPNI